MSGGYEVRPAVEFASGQQSIKGEDYLLVQPRIVAPKQIDVPTYSRKQLHLSDSASSQEGILQDSVEINEHIRRASLSSNKGSDKLLNAGPASFGLFCVMDGHNGKGAAQHLQSTLASTLQERLPSGAAPSESNRGAYSNWCDDVQKAVINTFTAVNEEFACRGELAGTTATIVLQHGWHITVANLGDSRAILDTGNQHYDLSEDHRIATHHGERQRLEAMGAQIAPICTAGVGPAKRDEVGYGPLRVWPGGSCLSRGIGDFDIGAPVIACPYISQVRIPETGGRVIVASDGVWDGFENIKKLLKISRLYNCQTAPEKIIHCLKNAFGGLRDDTSLIVLDVMPPSATFTELAQQQKKIGKTSTRTLQPRRSSGSSGCLCFSGNTDMVKDDDEEPAKPPKPILPPQILMQIDVAEAAGLMTHSPSMASKNLPSWCTDDFCESVRRSQEAALNAWKEAHSIRSTGRMPSRMDLESFFSAVHHIKPLEYSNPHADISTRPRTKSSNPMEEQRGLDITTRPPSLSASEARQLKNGMPRSKSKKTVHFPMHDSEGSAHETSTHSQYSQNASTHFKDHVGQPSSYARKFGLYKSDLADTTGGDSSTEDDSHRAGSYLSTPIGSPSQNLLGNEAQDFGDQNNEEIPRRRSHGSFDSSLALPTVEEEAPSRPASNTHNISELGIDKTDSPVGKNKSQKLEDIVNAFHKVYPEEDGREATEMAVRCGKNRFINAGDASSDSPGVSAKSLNGRPPLPSPRTSPCQYD